MLDSAGNFYRTTSAGGGFQDTGTIFELSASAHETVLHRFTKGVEGSAPYDTLVRDPAGNLYGTTSEGGTANVGTVFRLSASGKFRVLHTFTGSPDGASSYAGLVRDSSGSLFGITSYGGTGICNGTGCGIVFEITPEDQELVLHSFTETPDGASPVAALVCDNSGNLYGTMAFGGTYGCGTIFKYTP